MKRLIPGLRLWDVLSANLVDLFIANSGYVAKRINRYYKREAVVIYPPVDIEYFLPVERKPKDFYLFFGQLVGYKRADLAIEACVASGRKLIVAGAGAKKRDVRKYEKSGCVSFRSRLSPDEIRELFASARALLFPGIEDFGIVPVEAQAAGCPVIAFRGGGALETIKEGVTGLFFDEQTPESLIAAMDHFERNEVTFSRREMFNGHVQQFSKTAFIAQIQKVLAEKKQM
jgi:glycosyltransferase involved in cell wall biosynthesis